MPAEWETTNTRLIEQLARNLMTSTDWHYGLPRTLDNIHRVASITRDRLSLEAWRTLNDFYCEPALARGDHAHRRRRLPAPARGRPARAGGLPRPHAREHDAQLRLVVPRHGPAHGARRQPRRAAARHLRQGQGRRGRTRAACSSRWSSPTASSPTARATGWRRCCRSCSTCCCTDESNPRAIAFQLAELVRHIDSLPQSNDRGQRIDEQRMALALLTNVRLADVTALAQSEPDGTRPTS